MKLTLTDDEGVVIYSWYIPDEESYPDEIERHIAFKLPLYEDRQEYERMIQEP